MHDRTLCEFWPNCRKTFAVQKKKTKKIYTKTSQENVLVLTLVPAAMCLCEKKYISFNVPCPFKSKEVFINFLYILKEKRKYYNLKQEALEINI